MSDRGWKIVEILIDKGILAVVLAGFGFWLNHSLETYKDELAQQRLRAEKRLDAMQAISTAAADLNLLFFTLTRPDRLPKDEEEIKAATKKYEEGIDKLVHAHNQYHQLFSDAFSEELTRYAWAHDGLRKKGVVKCHEHRDFVEYLYQQYGLWCQMELGVLQKLPPTEFRLLAWDFSTVNLKGTDKYLDENFEEWKHWRRQKQKPS